MIVLTVWIWLEFHPKLYQEAVKQFTNRIDIADIDEARPYIGVVLGSMGIACCYFGILILLVSKAYQVETQRQENKLKYSITRPGNFLA